MKKNNSSVAVGVRRIPVPIGASGRQLTPCAGLSQKSPENPRVRQSFPLSPGERAGVRASVNIQQFVGWLFSANEFRASSRRLLRSIGQHSFCMNPLLLLFLISLFALSASAQVKVPFERIRDA